MSNTSRDITLKTFFDDLWKWKCGRFSFPDYSEENQFVLPKALDINDPLIDRVWKFSNELFLMVDELVCDASVISHQMKEYMANRLKMGKLRYGGIEAPNGKRYDFIGSIRKHIGFYRKTGNVESLVNASNYVLLEFTRANNEDYAVYCYNEARNLINFDYDFYLYKYEQTKNVYFLARLINIFDTEFCYGSHSHPNRHFYSLSDDDSVEHNLHAETLE